MSMMPTGAARVAGVTGWPVEHSLSPRLHGYWLRKYGIDGIYAPFPIAPENFETGIRGLQAAGVSGVNVTVPHKRLAFEIADTLDPAAKLVGAVNTLVFRDDGGIEGRNTDAPGFRLNLEAAGVDIPSGPALLFGSGGAARAVIQALLSAGSPEIRMLNRNPDRARELLQDAGDDRLKFVGHDPETVDISDVSLVVNTTSLGMAGGPDLDFDPARLPPEAVVHDIVYTPLETGLLGKAKARGLKTVDGLGMLLHQAAPAFEAFFGTRPEVDQALRAHLLEVM